MEHHLESFNRLLEAADEVKGQCGRGPVKLAKVDDIAKKHTVDTAEVLSQIALDAGYVIDYARSEISCLTS
jgi:hypothetical protein